MSPDDLKKHFEVPTQTALAEKLGRPISTVAQWFQQGFVPWAVQLEIERDSGGKLPAERPARAARRQEAA